MRRADLPDNLTTFMLFTLLDTGVSSVCINRVFFAVQQLGDLREIGHIGRSAMNMMNQSRLDISADIRLHAEEVLVTFLRLMHLEIALTFLVLGRAGGMNDGGINDGALAQGQAFLLQITFDDREDCRGQLMLFQQVPEVHDRGVFRYRGAQGQACKLAPGRDFVELFFHLPAYSKSEKLIWLVSLMGGSDQVVRSISLHLGTCSEIP